MDNFENVKQLVLWIVKVIGKNKDTVIDPVKGADWNWIAAEVWRTYPGIFNEFTINQAIDFIHEAAENGSEA